MRTIVSIISEQTIPNYLFIREMYRPGDKLMFISSKKMSERIKWIENVLGSKYSYNSECIVFNNDGDEENWISMTTQIESALRNDEYIVNLTGGTKYMALAIQSLFSKHNSSFYYIPYPQNIILSTDNTKSVPISYRVSIDEYTRLYNQPLRKSHRPYASKKYNDDFFVWFTQDKTEQDKEIFKRLREYRDTSKNIYIADLEYKADTKKEPRIKNLDAFLRKIRFKNNGILTKIQIQYLTGGWFEEYVYRLIKDKLHPRDIILGPKTQSTNNDLDVVFTIGNKLHVIECKTGFEGGRKLNEIVYKASALKENLLGLSAQSFIFALEKDDALWSKAATNMGITYYGRTSFIDENKLMGIIENIRKKAYD